MARIATKHKDFEITHDEESGVWTCGDLGLSDGNLAKLRKAIDKNQKEQRKCDVPALLLSEAYWHDIPVLSEVRIKLVRESGSTADVVFTKATKVGRFSREAGEREQVSMSDLYPLDARAKVDVYVAAKAAERDAEKAKERAKEDIVAFRFTAERIREAMVQKADAEA